MTDVQSSPPLFRGEIGRCPRGSGDVMTPDNDQEPPGPFEESAVIEFARNEMAATLGWDVNARFFLAGGAFKTLLTGQPPRDLDLWTPSVLDRESLIRILEVKGSRLLPAPPFSDAFDIRGRLVEVPHDTGPKTLDARLRCSDIGISAIGVEYRPKEQWMARIHPLAQLSLQRREVLLLKPLVNWKYGLTTLERMHRYAEELGFEIPSEEVDHVWHTYDEQPPEEQRRMIERYLRTAEGGYNIAEEAAWRCR